MKLNAVEKALMNNPIRSAAQRWYEVPLLRDIGGSTYGGQVIEIGCGRGIGTQQILRRFDAASVSPNTLSTGGATGPFSTTHLRIGSLPNVSSRNSTQLASGRWDPSSASSATS